MTTNEVLDIDFLVDILWMLGVVSRQTLDELAPVFQKRYDAAWTWRVEK